MRVFHARGARAVEHDARGLGMGAHGQVKRRASADKARRAWAPAAVDGALEAARAGLGVAAVVGLRRPSSWAPVMKASQTGCVQSMGDGTLPRCRAGALPVGSSQRLLRWK